MISVFDIEQTLFLLSEEEDADQAYDDFVNDLAFELCTDWETASLIVATVSEGDYVYADTLIHNLA